MAEYIDRENYCENICHCSNEYCDRVSCPIWKAPAADVAPVVHGQRVTHYRSGTTVAEGYVSTCCDMWNNRKSDYCPNCGARMDGDAE
nr:MAG TPA: NADH-PPase NADH pyrophosphatase zinc ribbon domain [Caudoviricetes sp.]